MTPEMKKHLEAVVVNIANEKSVDAQKAFSNYLRLKTQEILVGESKDMDDKSDDKCSKCDCDPCNCSEDDKKPTPFKKKNKKDEDKDDDKDD
jgi:hypothetical protein